MDLPEVTVGIITYNRPEEIVRTITALQKHLRYPLDKMHWLVSDDASPGGYLSDLRKVPLLQHLRVRFISTPENGGWGRNANNLLAHTLTPYLFQIEDDKLLYRDLYLDTGVALLEARDDIGMIRYKGTAGTHCVFHQFEADVSGVLPEHVDGAVGIPGHLTYLQLDSGSPTLYLYSHGPHLKHTRFHQFYGAYPEGLKLGATEEAYAHIVKDRMTLPGAPGLVIFPEWVLPYFEDFGQSYQGSQYDR